MNHPIELSFFTGPECSLCDYAQDVLDQAKLKVALSELCDFTVEKKNIRDNTEHYHLYAVRIPVLKREDNQKELGWPFDLEQFSEFLSK